MFCRQNCMCHWGAVCSFASDNTHRNTSKCTCWKLIFGSNLARWSVFGRCISMLTSYLIVCFLSGIFCAWSHPPWMSKFATFTAFVIPSLSPHLCPSLTSPLLFLFFFISPISAPLSSALFAVTFHAVIWAQTVCLTLAQDLSFHGNFIIVLDAFQAPLDTEALLMSKETCMKRGDVEASIWFCTQPHATPFNRFSMGGLWYCWMVPTCVAWYFIILIFLRHKGIIACNPSQWAVQYFLLFMPLSHCHSMHCWIEYGDLREYNMSIMMR